MNRENRAINLLLIGLILLEQLFLYYFFSTGITTTGVNAWGIFLSGLLVGLCLILKFRGRSELEIIPAAGRSKKTYIIFLAFLGGLVFLGFETRLATSAMPIAPGWSDVIPMVAHQCTQFLHGLSPYSPVNYFGYPEYPNNLPMKWLPYVIAEVTKTDYRLFAYVVWACAGVWIFLRAGGGQVGKIIAGLLLILSQYMVLCFNPLIAGETIEILLAAYYMFFMVALGSESGVVQGVFIAICLLSRYSLVLWLPLYVFVLFAAGKKTTLFKSTLTALACCAVVLILFLGRDLKVIADSYNNYDVVANFEWAHHHNDAGKPVHLFAGAGFAYFINTRFTLLSIPEQIVLLQRLQFAAVIVTGVLLGVWYWLNRTKININIFLMASFKIYLAVFLFFLKIPYMYLMCVGGFVSVVLFCEQLRYRRPEPREALVQNPDIQAVT